LKASYLRFISLFPQEQQLSTQGVWHLEELKGGHMMTPRLAISMHLLVSGVLALFSPKLFLLNGKRGHDVGKTVVFLSQD